MNHSKYFEKIKLWYDKGLWTREMVYDAVPKMITEAEYEEITGMDYPVTMEE